MSEKLKPATDLDSNVWYQLSELAVDDDDVDLKSMLQPTSPGGDLRVWDANQQSYWQFVCYTRLACKIAHFINTM